MQRDPRPVGRIAALRPRSRRLDEDCRAERCDLIHEVRCRACDQIQVNIPGGTKQQRSEGGEARVRGVDGVAGRRRDVLQARGEQFRIGPVGGVSDRNDGR